VQTDRLGYKHSPIASIDSLALRLSTKRDYLYELSKNVDLQWKPGKSQEKNDGSLRETNDARHELKNIHGLIKERILVHVNYPCYILGGISSDEHIERGTIPHANLHSGQSLLVSEDIANFFPSTTTAIVKDIWQNFFQFTPEVATVLTDLTTHNDCLPQGWITSNHLANLALWRREHNLYLRLQSLGFRYSRFVDDINASSDIYVPNRGKKELITLIYSMLFSSGYSPKRAKHKLATQEVPMKSLNLNVNGDIPSLPKSKRSEIRAAVHKCECTHPGTRNSRAYRKQWNRASGKVAWMSNFHQKKGGDLRERLKRVKPITKKSKFLHIIV